MKRRRFLSMMPPAVVALTGCGKQPFFFILIADPQLGMIADDEDGNNFVKETEMLETVMFQINEMKPVPKFVVVCGDLTQNPEHEKQIREYKRLMSLLKHSILHYNVSGNHDFKGNPNPENIEFYRKTYGQDWYSFHKKNWNFTVLNSTLMKFPEGCREEADAQLEWLKKSLEKESRSQKKTIIFMHHPFFDNYIDEEDGYHNIPGVSRRLYLDLFADYEVTAVFSGHRHTTIPERSYHGVRLINTNAVCNSFDNKPGLRVVRTYENSIENEYYLYDALPVKVIL